MKKGFTLIELLVVISIIGILVAVAVASYTGAQIKARDARRRSDMKAIQSTMEQYYNNWCQFVCHRSCNRLFPTPCSI